MILGFTAEAFTHDEGDSAARATKKITACELNLSLDIKALQNILVILHVLLSMSVGNNRHHPVGCLKPGILILPGYKTFFIINHDMGSKKVYKSRITFKDHACFA